MALHTYIPQDRLRALVRGLALPERTHGTALFADISGFTTLTENLARSLGARRGIEVLSQRVNDVYEALISEIESFGGSVICFSGDAITCWFDASEPGSTMRAACCAQAMQTRMQATPDLCVKVALSTGPARRLAVGRPEIQLIDVLAGATVARAAQGEHLAKAGEVLIDDATATVLGWSAGEARQAETDTGASEGFRVLDPVWGRDSAGHGAEPVVRDPGPSPAIELLRRWVLPFVHEREASGQGLFATDLRPAAALFVRFDGLDYDQDDSAREALGHLVSTTQIILQRHGGVLLELTVGDKGSYMYGSFGAAQVHEDDACRALRAALALQQAHKDGPGALQIGLSSGTMRVGGYGSRTRQSFGAMGDDVNLAARLMSTATGGEILISGRVRNAVADEFALEARPPLQMKGKAEPGAVFAVLGLRQQRAIRLQEPVYALPMIGREGPTRQVADRLAAARRGHGQIVAISAEAGMGKSRLVAEGITLARRSGFVGYGGACQPDALRTPYLAWQPVWRAFFDIDPGLPLRRQVRAAESTLQEHAPEHIDALTLLDSVLDLVLPDTDFTRALQPQDRKGLLETVLVTCLASAAREAAEDGGGLLLVLEDLQFIDPVSMDLLERVARAIETLPVLVLLSYRPPDTEPQQSPISRLQSLPGFVQIELGGLDAACTEQVIRAKLAQLFPERAGAVPAALIERINGLAQGNPFYVEELLNYLHDRGIDPRNSAALAALDLPTSLHSLVLSRIDQLASSQQLTIKVASIIGRVFRTSNLHDYCPALGELSGLKRDLAELDRLGFTPLESPEPELSYLFKHLVTQQVAYQSIAYATRRQLHGQYARFLETRYPERLGLLAPQLAHHYAHAEIRDKACHYLCQAGEQAAEAYANEQALDYFRQALELMVPGDLRTRVGVLLQREAVLDLLGQHAARRRDLAELDGLIAGLDDSLVWRARVATRRAKLETDVGDYAAAQANAQAAAQAIESIEPDTQAPGQAPKLLVDALLLQARAMFFAGQATASQQHLEHALSLARQKPYRRGEYDALTQLGLLRWHAGDYPAAQGLMEQALQLVEQAGDARHEIYLRNNLGVIAKAQAQFGVALARYEQAQRIARKIGNRSGEAVALNNMGSACLVSGDFVQAGVYAEQAARIFADINEPVQRGFALTNRAEAYRELGQYRQARDVAAQSLAMLRTGGSRRGEAIVLENIGLAEFALGQTEQARMTMHCALSIAREIGLRSTEGSTQLHLGLILTALGQHDQARQALDAAGAIAAELGGSLPALEVQAARAELMLAGGGPHAAEQALAVLDAMLPTLLKAPVDMNGVCLPLQLHLTAHRVLTACGDPRAATLLARARAELRLRSERVVDTTTRREYLQVAEHRALAELT
jgi:class 3 adenylate cyclase/tetratricopeptide (TPR) repeat protein